MKKKKILSFFLALCLCVALLPAPPAHALPEPAVESRAAVVMERTTGEVYFSKNADERVYPASTTKIMTVLLAVEAIEAGDVGLTDAVTASAYMGYDLIADGTSAGIVEGETMTLENLLYCAMLSSANEACNVVAEYIAGTITGFIERMNVRAAELGCENTRFANAHGLPNSNHYTTPSDFCRIAQEATSHDLFMQICNTETYDVPATNVHELRSLVNSNALISADSPYGSGYLYPDAAGIKTGYTNDAGYCLVSTASRDGIDLLCAVFGGVARDEEGGRKVYTSFSDTILLYDWVFENFSYQEVLNPSQNVASVDVNLGRDSDYVNLRPSGSVSLLLPNDYDPSEFTLDMSVYSIDQGEIVTAPVTSGEVLGEVSVLRGEQNCGTVKLVAASSVDLSRTQYLKSHINATLHTSTFRLILLVTILILAAYITWVILYRVKYRRYRTALAAARSDAPSLEGRAVAARKKSPSIEFFPGGENSGEEDDLLSEFEQEPESEPAPEAAAAAKPEPQKTPPRSAGEVYAESDRPKREKRTPKPLPAAVLDDLDDVPPSSEPDEFLQEEAPPEGTLADEPLSMLQDKADRDYFEEFFRHK